ncbi:MAG: histidinol phosphate phosphatase [Clostridia bacterium]|nr:histidinol phosphate phosphatase [Clostridia bacterium]
MITADLHVHSMASEDSETPVCEILSSAVNHHLRAIAVTDHVELVDFQKGAYDVAAEESWALLESAAVPHGLRVARGIELGEPCFDTALAARLLSAHPYDFVLASQHRLSDALPDYYFIDYSDWTHDAIVREMDAYFREVLRVVQWNGFDSLAHLTYPFRYLPSCWREGDYRPWQSVIDTVLGTLAENGKALEINTSGIRKGLGQTSPDLPLIRRFRELGGVCITVGSDAHRPDEIGADLAVAETLMREAGFSAYTVYFDRQPQSVSIDGID